jgi:sirohydrochlorin cobaltochelatase
VNWRLWVLCLLLTLLFCSALLFTASGKAMTYQIMLPPETGVMLCGHGSRNQRAVDEFAGLSEILRQRLPNVPVVYGYLEFANPVIHKGLDSLRAKGVKNVLALPGMLFAAGHAKNDIPSVLNSYAALHDGFSITYGRELGVDLKMIRAAGDRIAEAEKSAQGECDRHDTLLMVVGRGLFLRTSTTSAISR